MVWTTLRLSPSPDAFHESSDASSAITKKEGHSPQSHGIGKRALALLARCEKR